MRFRRIGSRGLTDTEVAWAVHGLLFAMVTLMWWPTLAGGKTLIHGDSLVHGLPLLNFLKNYLHGGESPLWVSEIYGGHPLFAEGQGGFTQPLNLLVAWMVPPVLGNNLFHYLCMLIAGCGVIRLCRILGSSMYAAAFAALAVVFSPGWLGQQQNLTIAGTLMWVPWALCAMECWLKQPTMRRGIWMALAGTMLVLAGYPQVLHGVVVFGVCTMACMPFSRNGRALWQMQYCSLMRTGILAVLLCIGLSAIQLLPLIELAGLSHRSGGVGLFSLEAHLSYMRGMLFTMDERGQVSVVGSLLVCMIVSMFALVKSPWRVHTYLVASVVLILLGMGDATWLFRELYAWHVIPALHFFRVTAVYLDIGVVGLAVLAAFAIDGITLTLRDQATFRRWIGSRGPWFAAVVLAWCALVYVGYAYTSAAPWQNIATACIALPCGIGLAITGRYRWIPVGLLGLLVIECLALRQHYLQFYDATFLTHPVLVAQPPHDKLKDYKVLNVSISQAYGVLGSKWPDLDMVAEKAVESNAGLANLMRGVSSMNGDLALQTQNRDILTPLLTDEVHGRGEAPAGLRAIDVLGVRYIAADAPLAAPAFQVAAHDSRLGLWLMENMAARPILQVYPHALAVRSADEALAEMGALKEGQLIVVDNDGSPLPPDDGSGDHASVRLRMLKQQSTYYSISVEAEKPCWIFLADANYPGWKARIDGAPTRVWTAQLLGKAVHVPAGNHEIVFRFRSASFHYGLMLSLFSLLVTIIILLAGWALPRYRASGIKA